jgi:hypothetical protein
VKVRVGGGDLAKALRQVGSESGDLAKGLVLSPRVDLADWTEVEEELVEIFKLTQAASTAGGPVVFLLSTSDLLGRGSQFASAVASGLFSGVRGLAFEGKRKNRAATAIASSADVDAERIANAVEWVLARGDVSGQVITLGDEQFGALLP